MKNKIKCFKDEPYDTLYCRFMFNPKNQSQKLYLANIPNEYFLELYSHRINTECDAVTINYNNSIYSQDNFWISIHKRDSLYRSNDSIKDPSFEKCINSAMDKENKIWTDDLTSKFEMNILGLIGGFAAIGLLICCGAMIYQVSRYCEISSKNNDQPNDGTYLLKNKSKKDTKSSDGCFAKFAKSAGALFTAKPKNTDTPKTLGLIA